MKTHKKYLNRPGDTFFCWLLLLPVLFSCSEQIEHHLLIDQVNQVRCENEVCKLTWDYQLESLAFLHSSYMAQEQKYSHVWKDGTTLNDRAKSIGIEFSFIAELVLTGDISEQDAVNQWMLSACHGPALIDAKYRRIGASYVDGYWTLIIAR